MFSARGGFNYLQPSPAPTPTDATAGWFGGGYGGATPGNAELGTEFSRLDQLSLPWMNVPNTA